MVSRCKATSVSGSPCSAQPVRPSGYCYWHAPELEAERAAARRRGGSSRSNTARAKRLLPGAAMTLEGLQGTLSEVLKRVVSGSIEPGVGNAAANLARAMVAVDEATKTSDFDQRLAELERVAGSRRR